MKCVSATSVMLILTLSITNFNRQFDTLQLLKYVASMIWIPLLPFDIQQYGPGDLWQPMKFFVNRLTIINFSNIHVLTRDNKVSSHLHKLLILEFNKIWANILKYFINRFYLNSCILLILSCNTYFLHFYFIFIFSQLSYIKVNKKVEMVPWAGIWVFCFLNQELQLLQPAKPKKHIHI